MDMCRERKWGDPVRVKASFSSHSKRVDGHIVPEYRRFSLDPQLTSFETLHSLLSRAFDIQTEFLIQYRFEDATGQEMFLQLISDWDLEAAFDRAADPYLCLRIDPMPVEQAAEEWDLVSLPPNDYKTVQTKESCPILDPTLQNKILTKVEKTISLMQQALNFSSGGTNDEFSSGMSTSPLSDSEFTDYRDGVGTLINIDKCRQRIFQGGLEPSLRRVVWKHLLNVYPDGLNGSERMRYMSRKTEEYQRLKNQWMCHYNSKKMSDELKSITGMVKKDVLRTDRQHPFYGGGDDNPNVEQLFNILTTYSIYHPSTGYCQGMSDMASPILYVMGNEAHAYIAFTALMGRLKDNFSTTGAAMTLKFEHLASALAYHDPVFFNYLQRHHAIDLLFCYRWLLLEMKREFAFEDALRMLEVMWSSLPMSNRTARQEELALFERMPDLNAVSQPIPLPSRPKRESVYTKVCSLRRQSSSPATCHSFADAPCDDRHASSPLGSFNQPHNQADDDDWDDDAFVSAIDGQASPTFDGDNPELPSDVRPADDLPSGEPEVLEATESHPEQAEDGTEEATPLLQGFEVIPVCEEAQEPPSSTGGSPSAVKRSLTVPGPSAGLPQPSGGGIRPNLPAPEVLGCGNPFLIFLCLTVLLQHRDFIMSRSLDSTSLAMHFDRLVRKHNVERVLGQARTLYYRYLSHFSNSHHRQQQQHRSRSASPRRNLGV